MYRASPAAGAEKIRGASADCRVADFAVSLSPADETALSALKGSLPNAYFTDAARCKPIVFASYASP